MTALTLRLLITGLTCRRASNACDSVPAFVLLTTLPPVRLLSACLPYRLPRRAPCARTCGSFIPTLLICYVWVPRTPCPCLTPLPCLLPCHPSLPHFCRLDVLTCLAALLRTPCRCILQLPARAQRAAATLAQFLQHCLAGYVALLIYRDLQDCAPYLRLRAALALPTYPTCLPALIYACCLPAAFTEPYALRCGDVRCWLDGRITAFDSVLLIVFLGGWWTPNLPQPAFAYTYPYLIVDSLVGFYPLLVRRLLTGRLPALPAFTCLPSLPALPPASGLPRWWCCCRYWALFVAVTPTPAACCLTACLPLPRCGDV